MRKMFLILLPLFLLAGCASYRVRPLPRLSASGVCSPFVNNNSVSFAYHVFDQNDCKKYLDRDVISKGYQPVHLTIVNNSNRSVVFSRKNMSIETVDAYTVAEQVQTNTVARAVGYGTVAVFIWPFAIPAIVDGIGSAKANEQLSIDFAVKSLQDQVIEPNESINGLVFVPVESFKPSFKIALSDPETSKRIILTSGQPNRALQHA